MKKLFLLFWMFPQNILAIIFILVFGKHIYYIRSFKGVYIYYVAKQKVFKTLTLGFFMFFTHDTINDTWDLRHEYGHYIQSTLLGPFYLLIVGIPALIIYIRSLFDWNINLFQYDFFPENWANDLGKLYVDIHNSGSRK